MGLPPFSRPLLTATLAASLAAPPASAFINLNEGRDHIMVSSSVSMGHDSNLFANSGGGGDTVYSANIGAEYIRRAGLISLDASVGLDATSYSKYSGENFRNPRFKLELAKQTGRTTGSLSLSAARESRADTAANLRDESWNYGTTLEVKYPLLGGRYAFTGTFGTTLRDFADNTVLSDLRSSTAGLDFYYILGERSLLAGYRLRRETTSADTGNYDHSLTAGVSGLLLAGLNGMIRFGYQYREPTGLSTGGRNHYHGWTSTASTTWNYSRRLSFNGQLSKDFATTSTNVSVDTLATALSGQYQLSSRTKFSASTGVSRSRFLDASAGGRQDLAWNWNVGFYQTIFHGDFLKLSAVYGFTQNWSTLSFADFQRRSFTITASTEF